jgi:phosphinothricin acetyltransferase
MIRPATPKDAEALTEIYNYYIRETIVSFEEDEIATAEMWSRVEKVLQDGYDWLVYEKEGEVLGYAYSGQWNSRCAYRLTAETSVYLKHTAKRQGIGTALYTHLLQILKATGMHSVIGGISLPNAASQGLHEKMGYLKAAHYKEVGYKFGKWIDVGYWQKQLV